MKVVCIFLALSTMLYGAAFTRTRTVSVINKTPHSLWASFYHATRAYALREGIPFEITSNTEAEPNVPKMKPGKQRLLVVHPSTDGLPPKINWPHRFLIAPIDLSFWGVQRIAIGSMQDRFLVATDKMTTQKSQDPVAWLSATVRSWFE